MRSAWNAAGASLLAAGLVGVWLSSVVGVPTVRHISLLLIAGSCLALVLNDRDNAIRVALAVVMGSVFNQNALPLLGGSLLLAVAAVDRWHTLQRGERVAVALAVAVAVFGVTFGWLLNERSSSAPSIVFVFVFAALLAANTVGGGATFRSLVLVSGLIGATVGYHLVTHPVPAGGRGAAVAFGLNANGAGAICGFGALASLILFRQASGIVRLLGIVCASLSSFGLIASGSRGALLAALGGAVFVIAGGWVGGRLFRFTLITVGMGVGIVIIGPWFVDKYLTSAGRSITATSDLESRRLALEFAVRTGLEHPIFGVGFGRLDLLAGSSGGIGVSLSAHNAFAGVFAAAGLFTILPLVGLISLAIAKSARAGAGTTFPLVVYVVISSISIEWYFDRLLAPLFMAIVGVSVSSRSSAVFADDSGDDSVRRGDASLRKASVFDGGR